MSEAQMQFQKPEGERLYRYHPDTGFTEVSTSQAMPSDIQVEQTTQAKQVPQYGQSQMYTQSAPVMENQAPTNVTPTYGYMPPFAQQIPQATMPPFAPHLAASPLGINPQAAALHEAHMKQMQDYANAQAAYMAFMAQNGALFGATQGAQNAQSTQASQSAEQSAKTSTDFSQERMQAMYQTVNDVINGKAEPEKVLGLFQGISTDFWKGAALGAAAIALYNCTPIKDMIATSLGTLLAATGLRSENTKDDNLDEDGFEIEPDSNVDDAK